MRHLNARGLTLIDLTVGLSIATLLAIGAAPYCADYIANSRLREGGELLLGEALAAQSEAVKRNNIVRLSTNGATIQVIDRRDTANPVVLRQRTLSSGVFTVAASAIDFGSEGRPVPLGTHASINLSKTGITCSGGLHCPGLRVDGGGAIRLCDDTTAC